MNRAFKKIWCMVLSVTVILSCIAISVDAEKMMFGDIFFETDFNDFCGLSDSESRRNYFVDKSYGIEAWATNSTIDEVVEEDGNVAMGVTSTAETDEEIAQQKVQLRFTLNTAESITREGGKLYIAYEAEGGEDAKQSYWRYTSVDEGEGSETRYLFYMDYPSRMFYANNDDFLQWGNKANSKPLAADTRYFVEQVVDWDKGMYYSFVNGEAFNPVSIANINENIGVLEFVIIGNLKLLDNLKVSYMKPDSFNMKAEKLDDNKFALNFSEGLKFTDGVCCLEDGVSVINENRPAEITDIQMISGRRAVVTLAGNMGDRYTISLNNVVNCIGSALSNPTISFNEPKTIYTYDGSSVSGTAGKWNGVVSSVNDADAEDGKALKFTQDVAVTSTETYMEMFLGDYIYMEGDLEVEYRMKVNEQTGMTVVNLGEWNNPNDNRINGIFIWGNDKKPQYCNVTDALTGSNTALLGGWGSTLDTENYHVYKTVYHFDEGTADTYIDGALKNTGLVINNFDAAKEKKAVRYLNLNMKPADTATTEAPPEVHFDYIKINQKIKAPYIKSAYMIDGETKYDIIANPKDIPVTAEKLEITFGGNIKAAWATEGKIDVEVLGETVEGTTFGYDKINRVCTMEFADDLQYETKYGIDLLFIDMHAVPVNPSWIYFDTVKDCELKDAAIYVNDTSVSEANLKAGDKVEFEATAVKHTEDDGKSFMLILAVYENGMLVAEDVVSDTLMAGETPVYASLTLPENGESFEIRAFFWNSNGIFAPIGSTVDFE